MNRFTFRKIDWRWPVDDVATSAISWDGECCGYIIHRQGKFRLQLQLPATPADLEKNPNCRWAWKTLKIRFATDEQARKWVQANKQMIREMLYKEAK